MKVLFFGLGGVGQRHLRNLLKIDPNITIGAVRAKGRSFEIGDNLKPDYNTDIISKYNIKIFPSFGQAREFDPDFAVVTNPTSCHVVTTLELVSGNVPVFLEKPISNNYDKLQEVVEVHQERQVPVMVGYMMRFNPCAIKIKELIESQKIGKIYSVVLIINSYVPSWHSYEKYNEFYAGMKSLGGGVVLTEIHELDLLNWYFGAPQRLLALGGKLSSLDIDVEDTVSVLMEQEYKKDKFPININMSFVQKTPLRRMTIQGEKGIIEWDISSSKILIKNVDGEEETVDNSQFQRNEMFIQELMHFIECIKEKKEPCTSLYKVIDGHLTALAIKDSLENKLITEQPKLFRKEIV